MRYTLDSMLPERAFAPRLGRGFGAGGMTLEGGSGGGGQPTQNTTYSTNVPEYARPYVENMLESTQKQIYTDDMTGFRPYKPYSTDVNNYFAGFSPLQTSAQQATAGLKTPGQFGDATNLAGASGLGAFNVAQQAMGAGQQFAQQAQDPRAMQGYMSPYMQNVVDYQKSQALRDFQMGQPMMARQAVGQGAFGGNRLALQQAEAQRGLMSQLQGISATGSQKAFEDAQRQQQFGAQLGMQGLQTGLQGYGQMGQAASTLGQLGGQQLGAQKEIIGLQSQMGKEQQALEQNKINQAIQDYAIAQQYPFMQLGMMNAMLRGLPMQTQSTQLYQAQPSMLQQGIGLAGAGASLFGGRAAGGAIKEYREGGIIGYAPGGVIDSTRAQLEQIADMPGGVQKLEQIRNSSTSDEVRKMAAEVLTEKRIEAQAEQQTQKARMSGIALAGGPAFESQSMAGGGIIAFAGEGPSLVEDPQFGGFGGMDANADQARLDQIKLQKDVDQYNFLKDASPVAAKRMLDENPILKSKVTPAAPAPAAAPKPEAKAPVAKGEGADTEGRSDRSKVVTGPKTLADFFNQQKELGPKGQVGEGFEKFMDEYVGDKDRLSRKERLAMAKGFLEFASTAGPVGVAAAKGLGTYATGSEAAKDAEDKIKFETAKIKGDLDKARRAEQRGDVEGAQKAFDSAANRDNQIKVAQMQLAKSSEFERQYEAFKNNPAQFEQFRKSLTAQDDTARLNAYVKADAALGGNTKYLQLINSKKPEDQAKAEKMRSDKITEYLGALGISQAPAAAAPQAGPDGTVNIPGKGTFKQLPNGNYVKV
jgi:hypothetical protein